MAQMTGKGGLLPEQVWDEDAIPARGLEPGRPSGSAMPLVWAHAEFIKLCLSAEQGHPVDRPSATWARYGGSRPDKLATTMWSLRLRTESIQAGSALCFVLPAPALIHWGHDGWKDAADLLTADCGIAHVATLPATQLAAFRTVEFTLDWPAEKRWQGQDFQIRIEPSAATPA
jgi:glucoamylase